MDAIIPINASDKSWTRHRYVLCFGAYGWTRHMVWANSLDDALDECVDWIADHQPGLLMDDEVAVSYREAIAEGKGQSEAWEEATVDMVCAGNAGHYIASWEWAVVAEDPTREEILRLQGRVA